MATREERIKQLAIAAGTDIGQLQDATGDLSALQTTAKSNLVGAVNEAYLLAREPNGAQIDDSASVGARDVTWSAEKTSSTINGIKNSLDIKDAFLQAQINSVGGGKKAYITYAEMVANKSDIAANSSVDVVNDGDTSKNGTYAYNGTTFTKSPYDPLTQAKAYADSNPQFKSRRIEAGDDFNNLTQSGLYYHYGRNLAKEQVVNGVYSGANLIQGVLRVINAIDTTSSALFQTYYSYLDSVQPVERRRKNDGTFTEWRPVLSVDNLYDLKIIPNGQDVLALEVGDYFLDDFSKNKGLVNLPEMPYFYGRIEVRRLDRNIQKSIVIEPYGRDANTYYNKRKEDGWLGWQTIAPAETLKTYTDSKTNDLKAHVESSYVSRGGLNDALASYSGMGAFGAGFTPSVLDGDRTYSSGHIVGYNGTTGENGAVFNEIVARVSNAGGGDTEFRVFFGDNVFSTSQGYQVTAGKTLTPNVAGLCLNFPTADDGKAHTIKLDKLVSIPSNTGFVIAFKKTVNSLFQIGYSTTPVAGLENHSFSLWVAPIEWGEYGISTAATSIGYYESGFKLRVTNSASSSTTGPEASAYVPELVLPAKIYGMAGLQSHIYQEHVLPEPSDCYLHTVRSSRGMHTNRGWEYAIPSEQAAGTIAINWTVSDKQTGGALNSASTSLVIADPSKAGNKKVLVIGDSYINAGVITQRLLDISAADSLKLSMVGTRGSSNNKHEGRGGWTINDYATEGRTYRVFTVSGVTVPPAINSAIYSFGGGEFTVQETNLVGGAGTITCYATGTVPTGSGVLTKTNSSTGDATIAFSSVTGSSGNPFWFDGALDFGRYISSNSLATPDVVIVHLGVNDSFGRTTDTEVVTAANAAFAKLDNLIDNIKIKNPAMIVAVVAPNTYADQDSYGFNYGCNYTSWRTIRNMVLWNKELYKYYGAKEAQKVYPLAAGLNVDTVNNFPTTTRTVNSHNDTVITVQNNSVHPASSGYKQIGDAMFAFIKSVS